MQLEDDAKSQSLARSGGHGYMQGRLDANARMNAQPYHKHMQTTHAKL